MKEVYQSGGCGDNFISYICNSRCCNICSDSDAGRQVPGSGRAGRHCRQLMGQEQRPFHGRRFGEVYQVRRYGVHAHYHCDERDPESSGSINQNRNESDRHPFVIYIRVFCFSRRQWAVRAVCGYLRPGKWIGAAPGVRRRPGKRENGRIAIKRAGADSDGSDERQGVRADEGKGDRHTVKSAQVPAG